MLDDLMEFAATMLVDNGRLSFWMPTANDEELVLEIPSHHCLELVSVCVQTFNKCMAFYICLPTQNSRLTHQARVEEAPHIPKSTRLFSQRDNPSQAENHPKRNHRRRSKLLQKAGKNQHSPWPKTYLLIQSQFFQGFRAAENEQTPTKQAIR